MSSKPTLDAIRARQADKRTLWMLHGERDVGFMLDRDDARETHVTELERLLSLASAAVDDLTREKRSLQARLDAVRAWTRRPAEARDLDELRVVLGDVGEVA